MRFLSIYRLGLRYPIWVLSFCALLSLGALYLAKQLKIETDFSRLLPENKASVKNFKKMKETFGSMGFLVITVDSNRAAVSEDFADQLVEKVARLDQVRYVDFRRPVDFFKSRQWLFIDTEDLKEMEKRIDRSLELQEQGVSPIFSDLMDFADPKDRPDLTFEDIKQKYQDEMGSDREELSTGKEGKFLVIKIRSKQGSEDFDSNAKLLAQVEKIVASLKTQKGFGSVEIGYTGSYKTSLESIDFIKNEMAWISAGVSFLLILILILYFRSFASAFLVGLPLLVGVSWTAGLVFLTLKHVNIITAFSVSILAGLGSDYGIYLLSRFTNEVRSGTEFYEACRRSFQQTGKATLMAMLTTVGAFGALVLSDFELFVEFGLVGCYGLVFNFLAMMLMMPSMLMLFQRKRPDKLFQVSVSERVRGPVKGWWRPQWFYPHHPKSLLSACFVLVIVSTFSLGPQSEIVFEEGQLDNKELPSNKLYDKVKDILGGSIHPTVLMVKGWEKQKQAVEALDEFIKQDPENQKIFSKVAGLSTFVPEHQEKKIDLLNSIIQKYPQNKFVNEAQKREFTKSVRETLATGAFVLKDLPEEVSRNFISPVDPNLFAIFLFPNMDRGGSENMRIYNQGVRDAEKFAGMELNPVGGSFISEDILNLIQEEAPKGFVFIIIFFTLVLFVSLRKINRSLLILVHLVAAIIVLSGVLYVFGINLNFFNISVFPIILGTGIDCFIHFGHRYDETKSLFDSVNTETPAIFVSNLTSIVGFGGLMFTTDVGLKSIGYVSVAGLVVVTIFCLFIFPRSLLLTSFIKSQSKKSVPG